MASDDGVRSKSKEKEVPRVPLTSPSLVCLRGTQAEGVRFKGHVRTGPVWSTPLETPVTQIRDLP